MQLAQQWLLLHSASSVLIIEAERGGPQLYVCTTAPVLVSPLLACGKACILRAHAYAYLCVSIVRLHLQVLPAYFAAKPGGSGIAHD